MIGDAAKAAAATTAAAVVQISFVDAFRLVDGRADVVLLTLVCVALLRGPVYGAVAGFWAGLIADVGTLGTLGLGSLLLTVAGYWAGRIGDVTSQHEHQRARILLSVTVVTVGYHVAALVVHLLLGDAAAVGTVLGRVMLPTLGLELLLALPAYALFRRLLPPPARRERASEVAIV